MPRGARGTSHHLTEAVHAVVLDALRATVAEKDAAMARQAADHPVDLWEADHQGDHPDFQDKPGC